MTTRWSHPDDDALRDLLVTLDASHQVDRALLEHLTLEMMHAVVPGGGMSVAQHLAHLLGATKTWLARLAPDEAVGLPDLFDRDAALEGRADAFAAETEPARVSEVAETIHDALVRTVADAAAVWPGALPHRSITQFVTHMMVHAAHHRGQILLALKASGHPLPDEDAMWQPWKEAAGEREG